ncbi:hypothetical protein PPERSA_02299 [Pseudocohnilembus persalinus]|uniref:Lebercilin domain-containing protein n=1 Tax=Pseudocohnilembus persalinus TaxID=266149 RepID=A0A0V0QI12_PSEPJ|nr:hypothetical protein PPERSA_02299 [Pseudocohnilembus persalinus]|eukprot:KRX01771.1 hypothetical protein PPERSA_02299 [Pseudocohnilembus persalinus]
MNSQYLGTNWSGNKNQNQGNSLANSSIRYGSNVFLSVKQSPSKYKVMNSFDFQQSQQELNQKEEVLLNQIQQMKQLNQKLVGDNDFLKQKLDDTVKSSEKSGRQLTKQAIHVLTLEQENKQLIDKIKGLKRKEIYQEELIKKIESGDFDQEIYKVAQDNEMKKQHLKYLTYRDQDVKTNLEDLEIKLQNDLIGVKQKIKKLQEQNAILEHQDKTYKEISKKIDEERLRKEIESQKQAEKIQEELLQQQQLQQKSIKKQGSSYKTIGGKKNQNINSQNSFSKFYSASEIQQQQQQQQQMQQSQNEEQFKQQLYQQQENNSVEDPQKSENCNQSQNKNIKISELDQDQQTSMVNDSQFMNSQSNNQNSNNNIINSNYNIRVLGTGSRQTTQQDTTPMSQVNQDIYQQLNNQSNFGRYNQQQQQKQFKQEDNYEENEGNDQEQQQLQDKEQQKKEQQARMVPVTHIQL